MVNQEDYIKKFIDKLPDYLEQDEFSIIISSLGDMHPADIAEIIRNISGSTNIKDAMITAD